MHFSTREQPTACYGSDYTAASGTLTVPAGSQTAAITVPVRGDTTAGGDETLT